MELTKYDMPNLKLHLKVSRMTRYLINVNLKTGGFYLNDLIRKELNLRAGMETIIACDEDSRIWYIAFGTKLDGFRLRKLLNQGGLQDRLCFVYKKPAHRLLEMVNAQIAATFAIAKTPTMIDGQKWYRILTKNPIRVN